MKLTERLTNSFLNDGIISEVDKEIVRFGLESLGGNLLGIVLTLVVGSCFKCTKEALILCLSLFPLRKNAGGFHAKTKKRCFFMSAIILIVSFSFYTVLDHTVFFYKASTIIASSVIWVLAPVGNPTKELDKIECEVYRGRSRIILGIEGTILILAIYFQWKTIMKSISMAFFIVSISLLMGLIKLLAGDKFKRQS